MIKLKELRKNAGYTQSELGKMIGVSKSTVCLYESGAYEPDIETLKKLADIFNVSLDVLVGYDSPSANDEDAYLIREKLRRDPEYRILFDAAQKAKPEHLRAAVAVLRSLKGESND